MQFAHTLWLFAGLIVCTIMGVMFYRFQKKRAKALERFASGHLLQKLTQGVSPGRRMLKRILLITAVAAVFVALAQPQMGFKWREVKRKGIDILMAVDTSKSMLAEDVRPNRLTRSKLGILDFVSKLEGDRVGLIPFAGKAFLMCPLTLDTRAFKESLDALDTRIIPEGGTDIAAAIETAQTAFSKNTNHKILVLVTDGEDLAGNALRAAKAAAKKGMIIYTVGVGTPAGELIPLPGAGNGLVKDENGQPVKSRLDEARLKEIAQVTGGMYQPLGQKAEGLDAIYQEKLRLVPKQDLAERMEKVPIDRFEWPLFLALILLIIEFALPDTGSSRKRLTSIRPSDIRRLLSRRHGQAAAGMLLALSVLFGARFGYASPGSAEKAYKEGKFADAMTSYAEAVKKAPEESRLQFNLGAAAYREKQYPKALKAFQAALNTEEISLQNKTYYNMGNTLYREGEKTLKAKPPQTIERWEASVKAYDRALKLNPKDEDARFNRELVKKKLEALKKQQKQNKKQNKNQKNKQTSQNQQGSENGNKDKNQTNQDQSPRNKGNTSANGKDQQAKNHNKNTKQHHDDQGNTQKQGEKEKSSSDKAEADKPNSQPGGKAAGTPQSQQAEQSGAKTPEARRPGQMTRDQARRLMDALKGDEKRIPMIAGNKGETRPWTSQKRRDW